MRQTLILHPRSLCPAVERIEVEVTRRDDLLGLRYLVAGRIADLSLPPPAEPVRADDLWKHSCFEAFLGTAGYYELNFAPSSHWAAYRFDSYRSGMRNAGIAAPRIETRAGANDFELRAQVELPGGGPLGLAAVIEEKSGNISYWALAHPPGPPDFHDPACFALELPSPE